MKEKIFLQIDNSSLVVFRVFFGFLIACESFGAIATGWVKNVLVDPQFTFNFIGFDFLQVFQGYGMYFYFIVMGIFGLLVMLGYRYRFSIIVYTIMWAGAYFMQKTSYNNHYYLLLVISFMMIFFPANKKFSLDTKLGYVEKNTTMPNYIRLYFIIQVSIVYFFASIAKFYPGWLDGTFPKLMLETANVPLAFKEVFVKEWFYYFITYSGLFFDLVVVPMLLFKRTRLVAIIASLIFHLFNAVVLQIGIFPFFALSFVLFFYEPEAIQKIFFKKKNHTIQHHQTKKNYLYPFIVCFLAIQVLLPIRHHFIKGDVLWTEEGHRLSWRMMLRDRNGYINITIRNNTLHKTEIRNLSDLTAKQVQQLACKPDFIWQYCQKIKEEFKYKDISIFIDCKNSVNRNEYKTLIDPKFDMAKANWNYLFHNEWILLPEN